MGREGEGVKQRRKECARERVWQNRCLGILIASSAIKNVERKIGN